MDDLWSLFAHLQGWGGWATTGVLLVALWRGLPAIQRELTARRKLQSDNDGSLRRDLFDRITKLEADQAQERHICNEQIAALRGQIEGLHRQLIALQIASGKPLALHRDTPESNAALDRLMDETRRSLDSGGDK